MGVNISATWTKETRPKNGLEAITKSILEDEERAYMVVALVRPKFSKKDFESGTETPTVKVVAVEALTDEADAKTARELLDKRFEQRTGATLLPFDDDDMPPIEE